MTIDKTKGTKLGVGVLVVRDDKVLLGKRCGKHMPGFYAAPGGHLETGETFAECAKREVLEETGLNISTIKFLMIGNYEFNSAHYVDVDMVAHCEEGEPTVLEPDKVQDWQWYSFDNLPSPMFIVTKRMIQAYQGGYTADEQSVNEILKQ